MRLRLTLAATLALSMCLAAALVRAEPAAGPATRPAYPLKTCVVSGDALGEMGPPVVEQIDGREVQFCCSGCVDDFKKDAEASHKKMDALIVEAQASGYALKTCPVSDEPLGSMGKPVDYVDRGSNQLIRLCCKGCLKTVKKDPAPALAKIAAAK